MTGTSTGYPLVLPLTNSPAIAISDQGCRTLKKHYLPLPLPCHPPLPGKFISLVAVAARQGRRSNCHVRQMPP